MTENREYYARYEERYQKMYGAGIERWGHKDDDGLLCNVLKRWVDDYGLKGKSIIDFACGEGACGVILSKLGCRYHGVDISKSAVMKTEESIKMYKRFFECIVENHVGSVDKNTDIFPHKSVEKKKFVK